MTVVQCPFCYGEINAEARKCMHCGEWVKDTDINNRFIKNKKPDELRETIDSRVTCYSCHKKMIPRIITGPPLIRFEGYWTPVPKKSVCPYCMSTYKVFPVSSAEKIGIGIFVVAIIGLFVVIRISMH